MFGGFRPPKQKLIYVLMFNYFRQPPLLPILCWWQANLSSDVASLGDKTKFKSRPMSQKTVRKQQL
jgi:hypothetical protein